MTGLDKENKWLCAIQKPETFFKISEHTTGNTSVVSPFYTAADFQFAYKVA